MDSELYGRNMMTQRRLRKPKWWHKQWIIGLDRTERLLESVTQDGKDRIGNSMKLVLWWHIRNWDDKGSSGVRKYTPWEWVTEAAEKTQSLKKRKPGGWETQYWNGMSVWIIKSPKITPELVLERVTESKMIKSLSGVGGVTDSQQMTAVRMSGR